MNRIDRMFAALDGRAALILYTTAGHPDLPTSEKLIRVVSERADLLEIGIPFSDPLADGPVIQASSQIALENGTTVEGCLQLVGRLRNSIDTPLVFLTYYNPVLRYGLERFAARSWEMGVDGVIVADLPPEEAQSLRDALDRHKLCLIPLVAPTSTDGRLEAACSAATGFVYCVSRTGVTGLRDDTDASLRSFLDRVRQHTDLPRAVGFGISQAEHVRHVARLSEGVIIGSALVNLISGTPDEDREVAVRGFVAEMKDATKKGDREA